MQTFNLDLSVKKVIPLLNVKQMDVGAKIQINITNNGDAYAIPADASFLIWYSGASGAGHYEKIDGRNAVSVSGNTATVELIAQMLYGAGAGIMCLVMNGADGSQIGTWNIPYFAESVPGANSSEATYHFDMLREAHLRAEAAKLNAEQAAEEAGSLVKEAEGIVNPIKYIPQELTEEQKAQARANIGAAAVGQGGGSLAATDDGDGNVEILMTGGLSVTDDGNGNVIIS